MAADIQSMKQLNKLQGLVDRLVQPARMRKEPLSGEEVKFLIESVKKQYKAADTALIEIVAPVVICGDTHGQYRDVIRLIDLNKWPPESSFLFLGDYVDRGKRSCEVVCLMFALKLVFPKNVHLLRGNHEAKEINKFYGFYDECCAKYSEETWESFNDVFTYMPLAALVREVDDPKDVRNAKGGIFAMHGGIPEKMKDFDDLRNLTMPFESPRDNEMVADLLWSDPSEDVDEFVKNPRGLGHQFGPKQVTDFCKQHSVDMIVRAHQVFSDGYKFFGDPANPNLLTVFSAPNYGGEFGNDAACLVVPKDMKCRLNVLKPFHRGVRK